MKIIKEGNKRYVKSVSVKRWKAVVRCRKTNKHDTEKPCGAELEIRAKDLLLMYWWGTHFAHYYAAFACSLCKKITGVDVPEAIFDDLCKRKKRSARHDGFDVRNHILEKEVCHE